MSLDLSYEIDLWGRVRRGFEGARADSQAAVAAYHNVLLILHADVAQNHFALRALDANELFAAFEEAEARGVRGGASYDYLHLVAARNAGAKRFYTLNLSDFLSFHRPGDPEILSP